MEKGGEGECGRGPLPLGGESGPPSRCTSSGGGPGEGVASLAHLRQETAGILRPPKNGGLRMTRGRPMPLDPTARGPISALELSDYYSAESLTTQRSFESTGDGLAVLCRRSDAVDVVVTRLYSRFFSPQLDEPRNFCLLALGGYGRRELFPHSDIDLLFLTESSRAVFQKGRGGGYPAGTLGPAAPHWL